MSGRAMNFCTPLCWWYYYLIRKRNWFTKLIRCFWKLLFAMETVNKCWKKTKAM